ncbi:MAG: hypothetical protein OXB88_07475 [Bacteriovoracales bacterium]|nr:hypothetical protein [Bacteriovoracales bacterium]
MKVFICIALGSSLFFFFLSRAQILDYNALSRLQDGRGICFSRIVQTFTARMIRVSGSNYLTPEFMNITEQCFDDITTNFYNKSTEHFKKIGKRMNRIVSMVHLFHEGAKGKIANFWKPMESKSISLQNRFSTIESLNDEMAQSFESYKSNLFKQYIFYSRLLLVSLLLLTFSLVIYIIREFYQKSHKSSSSEIDHKEVLKKHLDQISNDHKRFIKEIVLHESKNESFEDTVPLRKMNRLIKGTKRDLMKDLNSSRVAD